MTHNHSTVSNRTIVRNMMQYGLVALALPLAACTDNGSYNRGVEAVHQPVVSYSTYVYDVRLDGGSGLSQSEVERLSGWLESLNVGYGDKVAIATSGAAIPHGVQSDVATLLGRRGMMLGEDASAAAGAPMPGAIRLIMRRATASVPGCPDWSRNQESDMIGGTSSNYGCGVNGNLAAMVANPNDLVLGASTDSELRTDTSTRAIDTYRNKTPTGAGDLQTLSAGGK